MRVLLTGGTGYIGSHAYLALSDAGFEPVVLDDLSNSKAYVVERLERVTGRPVRFERCDVGDRTRVRDLIERERIGAVMHFAAFKAVGESVERPLAYYRNNLGGLIGLLEAMDDAGCRTFVFSSSSTVYGAADQVPTPEDAPRRFANPYAHTKLVGEDVLAALPIADPRWRIGVPRYFNPVGAHHSGLIGEDPVGAPQNLMPCLLEVAAGMRPTLKVFGRDWPTVDGTGVRDYVHVMDVAEGHVVLLRHLLEHGGDLTVNLGTGRGQSVLELVRAFESATGQRIPMVDEPRRPGDVAVYLADVQRAARVLGWHATRSLEEMCASSWRWQREGRPTAG